MSHVSWHPVFADVRNPSKVAVVRLDPYRERGAIEVRLSVRASTLHLTPAAARNMAERLLSVARNAERMGLA